MNFNTMDLIYVKEAFYEQGSNMHIAITKFINRLANLEIVDSDDYHKLSSYMSKVGPNYFKNLIQKQEMIELAYKISKLDFNFFKDMKVKVRE